MGRNQIIKGIYPPKMSREYALQQISNAYAQTPVATKEVVIIGGGGAGTGNLPYETSLFVVKPTGYASLGNSYSLLHSDHSHPTGTILETDPQPPVVGEIRRTASFTLVIWDGTQWRQVGGVPPFTGTPQPTGLSSSGSLNQYSRGDHSHATALIAQGSSQPPVERELRYNASDALVMRVGSNWVSVKVDWSDILNPPSIPSPSNTTPEPTGLASEGASTDYSRGDHSHPTAILAQSNNQTPVQNEIRFNTNNKLVRWDGSQWVELSVETGGNTPVQSTSNYSEQGTNDGEIWYRTNDRAFFFRVGGQRVYPTAALFTAGESAVNTGAGNRILLIDSTSNNLLRIGGSVNQTVFAYPKLPVISGGMSTNANWNTGAGSNPVGALWVDTSQGNLPFIYYNSFTPEKFLVGRVRYYSGSMATGAYSTSEPNGVLEMGEGGNLFVKASNLTYVYGYSNTFDIISDGYVFIPSGGTLVNNAFTSSGTNVEDWFVNNTLSTWYERYVQLSDDTSRPFFYFPLGFLNINSSLQSALFRVRVEMPYLRISGTNPEEWRVDLFLVRMNNSANREAYWRTLSVSSSSILSCGGTLRCFSYLSASQQFSTAYWSYYLNGVAQGSNFSVPTGRYMVFLRIVRNRNLETSPRSTTRHRYLTVMTTLPISRMWFD